MLPDANKVSLQEEGGYQSDMRILEFHPFNACDRRMVLMPLGKVVAQAA